MRIQFKIFTYICQIFYDGSISYSYFSMTVFARFFVFKERSCRSSPSLFPEKEKNIIPYLFPIYNIKFIHNCNLNMSHKTQCLLPHKTQTINIFHYHLLNRLTLSIISNQKKLLVKCNDIFSLAL